MRVLIDTNIFVYLALDTELLSKDVAALLHSDLHQCGIGA